MVKVLKEKLGKVSVQNVIVAALGAVLAGYIYNKYIAVKEGTPRKPEEKAFLSAIAALVPLWGTGQTKGVKDAWFWFLIGLGIGFASATINAVYEWWEQREGGGAPQGNSARRAALRLSRQAPKQQRKEQEEIVLAPY